MAGNFSSKDRDVIQLSRDEALRLGHDYIGTEPMRLPISEFLIRLHKVKKFDPKGEYTKQFVPELKELPKKYLYKPWEAPANVLEAAGVKLGETYPEPVVDVKTSRLKALDAFQMTKGS